MRTWDNQSHAELVHGAGHVAQRVTEQGLSGAKDSALWQHVCDTEQLFITLDLDFSDVRRFVPGTHPGVLLIRPRGKGREAVASGHRAGQRDPRHPRARGAE